MRDVEIVPLDCGKELVITTDNSGAIGEKPEDVIKVSNETVGYFACRVAMMELLSARGEPHIITMANFTSDSAWYYYKAGVKHVISELKLGSIGITGSTESNFPTMQSGLSITVIGTRESGKHTNEWIGNESFAVIGKPLVGNDVLQQKKYIAPLSLFQRLCHMDEIIGILPVGSKGIESAWQAWTNKSNDLKCELDIHRSAGPSTCFIIAFNQKHKQLLQEITGKLFYQLNQN